jgi:hypothetical protein
MALFPHKQKTAPGKWDAVITLDEAVGNNRWFNPSMKSASLRRYYPDQVPRVGKILSAETAPLALIKS